RHRPGDTERVGRRPEDVEGGFERRDIVLSAHEHGPQRAAEITLLLEVDEREGAGRVGEPAWAGLEPGIVKQARERAQARKEIRPPPTFGGRAGERAAMFLGRVK